MIAAAVPLVIIHIWKQERRWKRWGIGGVFPLLRSDYWVHHVFGRAAGFMSAITEFYQRGNWGDRLRNVSNAEHPCRGCGLRKCGGVEEGVWGGGGEERSRDGGRRGSMLWSDGGGTSGGEGEEALGCQRHLPETRRGILKWKLHNWECYFISNSEYRGRSKMKN